MSEYLGLEATMNQTTHEADKWIASLWQDATVQQVEPVGDCKPMAGTSTVVETLFDEKGALHLHMANGYWVPARVMQKV